MAFTTNSSTASVYSPTLMMELTTLVYNNVTVNDSVNVTLLYTTDKGNQTVANGTKTTAAQHARHAIYVYPGPVICMFGMVCNILNLCVLSQPELNDSPYTYLTAIAVADLGMLTISFSHLVSFDLTPSFTKAIYDAYVFYGVGNIFFTCSVWFIVVMTIERMFFIVRPLHTHPSVKKARIYIIVVVICSSLLCIPRFLCYEVKEYQNTGIYYAWGTTFQESDTFYKTSWFQAVMATFIPLVILLVANFILIMAVHRARKRREELHMSSNQEESWRKNEVRLTRTLISVVILFIVCTLPSVFVEDPIAYAFFSGDKTWTEYLRSPGNQTFIYVSNLLLFLNCSLNFVLYCAFNNKFRSAMKTFFARFHIERKRVHMTGLNKPNSGSTDSNKSGNTSSDSNKSGNTHLTHI